MKNSIALLLGTLFLFCGGPNPAGKQSPPAPPAVAAPETAGVAGKQSVPAGGAEPETVPAPAGVEKPEKSSEPKAEPGPASLPKLWDFFATWCPPCKRQAPIIEELTREYAGRVEIRSIDTDQEQDLARRFGIQAIPTLVFLDASGKELARTVGFTPKEEIVKKFQELGFIK